MRQQGRGEKGESRPQKTKQERMKGDTEGESAGKSLQGRRIGPREVGGAGGAMEWRHAGDTLRRCPQKGLRRRGAGWGGGAGRGKDRKERGRRRDGGRKE